MSAEQNQQKLLRTTAKSRFTRYKNVLIKYITVDKKGLELVNECYNDFLNAWKNVEEQHDKYVSVAGTGEENLNDEWINEIQNSLAETRNVYMDYKKTIGRESAISEAKNLRNICEQNFVELTSNLETSIAKNFHRETVLREFNLLSKSFEGVQYAHHKLSVVKESDDDKSLATWNAKLHTTFGRLSKMVDNYSEESKTAAVKKLPQLTKFYMEKLPLPKFDGNIRNYPRFIKDFKTLVLPNLSAEQAAFTLRQCLSANVQNDLAACDDDLHEMISRLNQKYSNPAKLVDSIISEIQKFRKIEVDDDKRFITFVDLIDRGYRDLKNLNIEGEMCNSHVLGIIEGKLPKIIQSDWYRMIYKNKIKLSEKFYELLEFLKIERAALEYGMSDLRISYDRKQAYLAGYETPDSDQYTGCLVHNINNHKTCDCRAFLSMSLSEKYDLLKAKFACFCCLTPNHRIENCPQKRECGDGCDKLHHRSLHPNDISGTSNALMNNWTEEYDKTVILPVMQIKTISNSFINVLWDTAANLSLISNEMAKRLCLNGKPVKLCVTVAGGGKKSINSAKYAVPIFDMCNNRRNIIAYGIDVITTEISEIHNASLLENCPGLDLKNVIRPRGKVDLLIGYDYASWHPTKIQNWGHLLLLSNQFGKCLGGSHPSIKEGTANIVKELCVVNFVQKNGILSDFFTTESLGTNCTPKCGGCKCGKCPSGTKPYTLREERELHVIEKGLSFHGTYWKVTYPWKKSPSLLPDNYVYALKALISLENRLNRDKEWGRKYSEQIMDMVDRKVARKLTYKEISEYKGPVHYIAHHAVVKPESKSTPIRIVFNSSANFHGHILNDYWLKGPNAFMNNSLGVSLRFREDYVGIVGDIKKMYNSVRISLLDQHCHRFLWREMETSLKPSIYAITAVNIGDRPSGTIATVALRKTAELKAQEYPQETDIIINSSYVDDIVDSVESYADALRITKNIDSILECGNFHIKGWTISGYKEPEEKVFLTTEFERVLGICWVPENDSLKFRIKINFSKKIKGIHTEPDLLSTDDIPAKLPKVLTKRIILSQVNSIFDPVGVLSPFVVIAKIYLRKLWTLEPKLGWDDEVPEPLLTDWIDFFRDALSLPELTFSRCVKPKNAVGHPMLVSFSDASNEAFGACIYLRWELSDGTFKSSLLMSKGRISPLKRITIVNLELSAAVLACRLRKFIERECRFKIGKFVHILDSEIVRSMIQKESYGFNTFAATRIGEIQESSNPSEWYWVDGKTNVADIMTRGTKLKNLGPTSIWQNGPTFLNLPFESWPIKNECLTTELPERTNIILTTIKNNTSVIDISRYSNYYRLTRTTARILSIRNKIPTYSLSNIGKEISPHSLELAEMYWVLDAQRSVLAELKAAVNGKGLYKRLSLKKREDGVYVVGKRVEVWNEMSYNRLDIPILPKEHRFSLLYARMVHRSAHLGVNTEVSKIRTRFWIVSVGKIS